MRFGSVMVMAAACWGVGVGAAVARAEGMREVKTAHYLIHTDLPKKFAEELATRMDTMYGEYEKRLPGFKQPAGAELLPAFLFTNGDDYVEMTKNKVSAGMFVNSAHPFLAAHMEEGRDDLRKTLQHEAFHQFAHFAIQDQLPPWINEGLAQVFEEGVWNGTEFWMGQVPPWRIRLLQTDVAAHRLVEFKKFMAIPHAQWNEQMESKEDLGSTNYNEAWALAHFLMESGRGHYREDLMGYLKDRHGGMTEADAVKKHFSSVAALQGDFVLWVRGLRPTAGATMMEHQEVLGQFLSYAHEKGKTFEDMEEFRNWVEAVGLREKVTQGRVHWETATNPKEYFCDQTGRMFGPRALELADGNERGMARDIVCHVSGAEQFRTHMYKMGDETMVEVLVQKPGE